MTSDLKYSIAASVQRCLQPAFRVRWSVHVGQKRDSFNPQAVYDDMHMNVARVIVSVRVGADNGLVSGEMLVCKIPRPAIAPYQRSSRCPFRPVGQS